MVIINLQKTPYDDFAAVRIYAPIDKAMAMLIQKFKITVDLSNSFDVN